MWESGTFHLLIKFTEDYPTSPPHVRFLTRMYHPNIYLDGKICLDILQNQWSAMYDIAAVLTSIQSLLNDPNPDSPANPQAAKTLVNNRVEYDRLVLVSIGTENVRLALACSYLLTRRIRLSPSMQVLSASLLSWRSRTKAPTSVLWLLCRNALKIAGLFHPCRKGRSARNNPAPSPRTFGWTPSCQPGNGALREVLFATGM